MSSFSERLQYDFNQLLEFFNDPDDLGRIRIFEREGIDKLEILIKGRNGTPYSKGVFLFHIDIEPDYPRQPPIVKCLTKIWHPNIGYNDDECYQWGSNVCLHLINRDTVGLKDGWKTTLTLVEVISQLIGLLDSFFMDEEYNEDQGVATVTDPLNFDAGEEFSKNPQQFYRHAVEVTDEHAKDEDLLEEFG